MLIFFGKLDYLQTIWESNLYDLQEKLFKETSIEKQGDILKERVDNFLIKMNNLAPFV